MMGQKSLTDHLADSLIAMSKAKAMLQGTKEENVRRLRDAGELDAALILLTDLENTLNSLKGDIR